jgi:hypothetical protein
MRLVLAVLLGAGCTSSPAQTPPDGGAAAPADAADTAPPIDVAVPADREADAAGAGGDVGADVQSERGFALHAERSGELIGIVGKTGGSIKFLVGNFGDASTGVPQAPWFSGTNKDDFSISGNTCLAPVAPATACAIEVTFTPRNLGTRTAYVHIFVPPFGVGTGILEGSGVLGGYFVLEGFNPLRFINVSVGTTSPFESVTARNPGSEPVTLFPAMVSSADFVLVGDGCAGKTLRTGEICGLLLAFRPRSTGMKGGAVVLDAGLAGRLSRGLEGTGL